MEKNTMKHLKKFKLTPGRVAIFSPTVGSMINTVGIQLSDMSGNRMAISSPVTEWFVIQVTIQLPD